jgi:hypothetical protein
MNYAIPKRFRQCSADDLHGEVDRVDERRCARSPESVARTARQ